jgi:hypothetical protein
MVDLSGLVHKISGHPIDGGGQANIYKGLLRRTNGDTETVGVQSVDPCQTTFSYYTFLTPKVAMKVIQAPNPNSGHPPDKRVSVLLVVYDSCVEV